jgi:hypothetical protein
LNLSRIPKKRKIVVHLYGLHEAADHFSVELISSSVEEFNGGSKSRTG